MSFFNISTNFNVGYVCYLMYNSKQIYPLVIRKKEIIYGKKRLCDKVS